MGNNSSPSSCAPVSLCQKEGFLFSFSAKEGKEILSLLNMLVQSKANYPVLLDGWE